MHIPPEKFSRDVIAALTQAEREARLRELEALLNLELRSHPTLADFQQSLYAIIELLFEIGHFLGPWEYDCEVEYWGGKSYMDPSLEDELLLRSEFPHGVRLAWRDYDALHPPKA